MTMKTTITRSGANWPPVEAGALCAQAGEINEFMHSPEIVLFATHRALPRSAWRNRKCPGQRSEKEALCHSVRRRPSRQISGRESRRPTLGDRLPQRSHQAQVKGE